MSLIGRDSMVVAPGAVHVPDWLEPTAQQELADWCRQWVATAGGVRSPRMPRGGMMSVGIACFGWHWFPYGYSRTVDDDDGRPVAVFPEPLRALTHRAVADASAIEPLVVGGHRRPASDYPGGGGSGLEPDVALINWYGPGAHMGMHADRDERSPAPVVSISLGDSCVFRFGTPTGRGRPWTDVVLESGDLFVFGGPSRLAFHGVPKVISGTGDPRLVGTGGRWNITVRETGLVG